jgi:hypothetical protein
MGGLEEFHDSRSEQHMGILGSVAALVARPIIGPVLTHSEVRHRMRRLLVQDTEQGARIFFAGLLEGDEQKRHIGEAMVATRVVRAEGSEVEDIPPDVSQEVHDRALKLPLGGIALNPLIDEETTKRFSALVDQQTAARPDLDS